MRSPNLILCLVACLVSTALGSHLADGSATPVLQLQKSRSSTLLGEQGRVLGLLARLRAGGSFGTPVSGAQASPAAALEAGAAATGDGADFLSRRGVSTSGGAGPGGSIDLAIGLDKKKGDLGVRTRSTLILVGSFLAIIIGLKQTGCAILVAFLQWAVFREGMAIVRDDVTELLLEAEMRGAKSLRRRQWGVFWVLGLAVYGKMLIKEIAGVAEPSKWMESFCRWYVPGCAALYVGLLLHFITGLKSPALIRYQLGQFSAAHLACFLVLPSALVSFAARGGLFWFVIASGAVIVNDIMAYICGRLFGRTSLTVLSPKKTWEGFIGAAISTSVAGWLAGRWLCGVGWLSSPRNVMLLAEGNAMDVGDIFLKTAKLPVLGLSVSRAEKHAFWIALMASLIGPFGGFFASGLKRAYGVKDFGDTIPGHGGAGDRFDCQVMLLPLVYFYLKAFAPGLDI